MKKQSYHKILSVGLLVFLLVLFSFSVSAIDYSGIKVGLNNWFTFDSTSPNSTTFQDSMLNDTITNKYAGHANPEASIVSTQWGNGIFWNQTTTDSIGIQTVNTTNIYGTSSTKTFNFWFKLNNSICFNNIPNSLNQLLLGIGLNTDVSSYIHSDLSCNIIIDDSGTTNIGTFTIADRGTIWHMFTMIYQSGGRTYFIIDANYTGDASYYVNTTTSMYAPGTGKQIAIFRNGGVSPQNATLDELAIWNRALNFTEITQLYNNRVGLRFSDLSSSLNQTWISHTPSNLTTLNLYNSTQNDLIINYSIQNFASNNSINILTKYNSTESCMITYQGGCLQNDNQYYPHNFTSNISSNFSFSLEDDEIQQYVTMLNDTKFKASPNIQKVSLTAGADSAKVMIIGLKNTTRYNIIETIINSTAISGTTDLYYCNSSYSIGTTSTSGNCIIINSIPYNVGYNYSDGILNYSLFPMTIINGRVNGVVVTNISYFVFDRNSASNFFYLYYDANQTYNNSLMKSTNNGGSWSNVSGIAFFHVHQTQVGDALCYKSQTDGVNESTEHCDSFDLINLPPSIVNFISPNESHYNGLILPINYSNASDDYGIGYYQINLCNADETFNMSLYNNSLNNTYNLSTIPISDGNYTICVTTYDIYGLTSISYSDVFVLDKISPAIIWYVPNSDNSTQIELGQSMTLNIGGYDDNLYAFEIAVLNNFGVLFWNTSQEGITHPLYNITHLLTPDDLGIWTVKVNFSDSHTKKEWKPKTSIQSTITNIELNNDEINPINKKLKKSRVKIDYSGDTLNSIDLINTTDRINFYLRFKNHQTVNNYINFRVNCSNIRYVENSEYPAHFVCPSSNDRNWIDFNSVNLISYTVTPCFNLTDCYDVSLYMKPNDTQIFKSIGGLNFNSSTTNFIVIEPTEPSIQITNSTFIVTNTCPGDIPGVLMYLGVGFLVLILVFISWLFRNPFVGVFSSIALIIYGWALAGCNGMIGLLIAVIGLSLVLAFALYKWN